MLYLDGAATTKPSTLAIKTFAEVSRETWMNPSSGMYEGGIEARRLLNDSRVIIADCIGAEPEQIFFTSGATEGANWIIFSNRYRQQVSDKMEHPCVHNAVQSIATFPYYINNNNRGEIDLSDLEMLLSTYMDYSSVLVSIMDSNNETGNINPTWKIAEICHQQGRSCRLFTDMTQSFAHSPEINVSKLGMDYAVGSAHKFGAFKGTGFVYVKEPNTLRPFIVGGHQERGMRAGTENVAGIRAMAVQFEDVCRNRERDNKIIMNKKKELISRLPDWMTINGSDNTLPNIISVTIPGREANKIIAMLAMRDIYLSAGSACSSGEDKPSRILKAMGLSDADARSTIRISIDVDSDIDLFLTNLMEVI